MLQFCNLDKAWLLYLAQLGIFWYVNETDWKDCRGFESPRQTLDCHGLFVYLFCALQGAFLVPCQTEALTNNQIQTYSIFVTTHTLFKIPGLQNEPQNIASKTLDC